MPSQRPSKVIIDTNVWISFLIGKKLQNLKDFIVNERIKLITTQQLIAELTLVTSRQKLKKYFAQDKVAELLSLINIISGNVSITKIDSVCRDPKDDFLLALSKKGKADFLITGDKDLLDIKVYGKTKSFLQTSSREYLNNGPSAQHALYLQAFDPISISEILYF